MDCCGSEVEESVDESREIRRNFNRFATGLSLVHEVGGDEILADMRTGTALVLVQVAIVAV